MIAYTEKNAEGLLLHALSWPVERPKAIVYIVHGQGEHIGRYDPWARRFNAEGFSVMGHDHQGFGKSEGKRGHARSLDAYLNDLAMMLDGGDLVEEGGSLAGRRPLLLADRPPIILYGHSMGGNLALNYVLRRQPNIAGLIATGPWIRLAFEAPALKVAVGRLLRHLAPSLTLPTGLDATHISHDPAVVEAYRNDPLVHDKVSAAAGIELLEAAAWLNRYAGEIKVPTLLMHGRDDKLTSAPATRELAERLRGDVTYREWPGLYHEIHHEKEQGEVFAFAMEWLRRLGF